MKIFLVCLAFCFSAALAVKNEVPHFKLDEELSPEDLGTLRKLVAKEMKLYGSLEKVEDVNINAFINDYLDRVLANVKNIILKNALDPSSLPDQYIDIKIGHTTLTEGQLNDTASIERYENATLSYNSQSKLLIAEMVLRFEDLKFIYKFHTKVTFISSTGHLHGDIEHIHIHVKLGFDFAQGLVFVDSIDFKHTGDIKVWVSGNALIDWITNAMTATISGILHNLILDIVKNIIAGPINSVVDAINHILHPSTFF